MSTIDPAGAGQGTAALALPRCRARTAASRQRSVEHAIGAMREHLGEPLSLQAIARQAAASPFHLDRIFRQVTGVPPFRFLAALRLDAARRLLLSTGYSATSICFEVGYSSVGSFTRQFSESVGLPPQRLRAFAAAGTGPAALLRSRDAAWEPPLAAACVEGRVTAPDGFSGAVFVGLFAQALPSGRPRACVLLRGPGPFRLPQVPDGTWHLFAAGVPIPAGGGPAAGLIPDDALRGSGGAVEVGGGRAAAPAEVALRPRSDLDPPLLVSLPVLLAERLRAAPAP
jgi:AraC-like DNA-binding protein